MSKFTLEKTFPIQLLIYSPEGKSILIQNMDLTFDMLTRVDSTDEDALMDAQIKQNVSFGKAMGWIEGYLNQSIMFENKIAEFGFDLNNNIVSSSFLVLINCSQN